LIQRIGGCCCRSKGFFDFKLYIAFYEVFERFGTRRVGYFDGILEVRFGFPVVCAWGGEGGGGACWRWE